MVRGGNLLLRGNLSTQNLVILIPNFFYTMAAPSRLDKDGPRQLPLTIAEYFELPVKMQTSGNALLAGIVGWDSERFPLMRNAVTADIQEARNARGGRPPPAMDDATQLLELHKRRDWVSTCHQRTYPQLPLTVDQFRELPIELQTRAVARLAGIVDGNPTEAAEHPPSPTGTSSNNIKVNLPAGTNSDLLAAAAQLRSHPLYTQEQDVPVSFQSIANWIRSDKWTFFPQFLTDQITEDDYEFLCQLKTGDLAALLREDKAQSTLARLILKACATSNDVIRDNNIELIERLIVKSLPGGRKELYTQILCALRKGTTIANCISTPRVCLGYNSEVDAPHANSSFLEANTRVSAEGTNYTVGYPIDFINEEVTVYSYLDRETTGVCKVCNRDHDTDHIGSVRRMSHPNLRRMHPPPILRPARSSFFQFLLSLLCTTWKESPRQAASVHRAGRSQRLAVSKMQEGYPPRRSAVPQMRSDRDLSWLC